MIQIIGKHRVKCGNIMDGIDDLMQGQMADFVYSDPPWGQGNLRYWQTMNHKMTGAAPIEISYTDFMARYFEIVAKYAKDVIVIEYGWLWRADVIAQAAANGFKHGGVAPSFYSARNLPLDIHLFSKSGKAQVTEKFRNAADGKGFKVVSELFSVCCPDNAQIVLDPMCGMGYTAQAAKDRGLTFYGNELNEKRLEKTINRLQA